MTSSRKNSCLRASNMRFLSVVLVSVVGLCLSTCASADMPIVSKYNASSGDEGYMKSESECEGCVPEFTTTEPQSEDNSTLSPSYNMTGEFDDDDGSNSYDPYYYRWGGIDILVAVFFVVAAGWLLMAIVYSAVVLVLLRLQARGELDFYDENFGLLVCCYGRIRVHFGCILRRYAIQLEREQQQRRPDANGDNGDNNTLRRVRIMTRAERRDAIERILNTSTTATTLSDKVEKPAAPPLGDVESDSSEEPVCTVCLCEYEVGDQVFTPTTCSHVFHKECIMDWLERRQNTDCPCCRQPIVSDDEVWEIVKKMRKARRKQLQRENGLVHRTISWLLGSGNRGSDNDNNNNRDGDDDGEDIGNSQQPEMVQSELRVPNEPVVESILGSTDIESGSTSDDDDGYDDDGSMDRSAQTPVANVVESENEFANPSLQESSIRSKADNTSIDDEKPEPDETANESDGDRDANQARSEPCVDGDERQEVSGTVDEPDETLNELDGDCDVDQTKSEPSVDGNERLEVSGIVDEPDEISNELGGDCDVDQTKSEPSVDGNKRPEVSGIVDELDETSKELDVNCDGVQANPEPSVDGEERLDVTCTVDGPRDTSNELDANCDGVQANPEPSVDGKERIDVTCTFDGPSETANELDANCDGVQANSEPSVDGEGPEVYCTVEEPKRATSEEGSGEQILKG